MFIVLPTFNGEYCINLLKVLFFYPKQRITRFEMEDGTILDFNIEFEEVLKKVDEAAISLP